MEKIKIRLVEPSDYMGIAMLSIQAGCKSSPTLIQKRVQQIQKFSKDKIIVVENEEKKVIAFIHGVPRHSLHSDHMVIIESLVVELQYRRKGIAKRLVHILENWARDNGYGGVLLAASRDHAGAHRFYENIGYNTNETQSRFIKYFSTLSAS